MLNLMGQNLLKKDQNVLLTKRLEVCSGLDCLVQPVLVAETQK